MQPVHSFQKDGMKTTFTIRIRGESQAEAAGAAGDCLEYLVYLEERLSRYIEGSDIWQINHMEAGDSLYISEVCHQCLLAGIEASVQTGGRFDVTLGTRIEHLKQKREGALPDLRGRLTIDPDRPLVSCEEPGRELDLGGVGKGFALDVLKSRLIDWGIHDALLSAGASTHLAVGNQPWTVKLTGDTFTRDLELRGNALSSSGTAVQGVHFVSGGSGRLQDSTHRVWVTCPTAALADAWSTALFLFETDAFRAHQPKPDQCFVESDDGFECLC